MKPTINISIPTPCHEKWEDFTPASGGRHCASCDKVVVDFSKMSDEDIVNYFKQRNMGTCGRFREDQLRNYGLPPIKKRPRGWQHVWASLAGAVLIMLSRETVAQERVGKPVLTRVQDEPSRSDTVAVNKFSAEGIVFADDDSALPGVSVYIKGTAFGTTTDAEGKFTLDNNVAAGDILVFSFVGMMTQEIAVTQTNANALRIRMKDDVRRLGEVSAVVLGGVQTRHTVSPRRWWGRVRSWFRS